MLGLNKLWVQKILDPRRNWVQKCLSQTNYGLQFFSSQILGKQFLGPTKFWFNRMLAPKKMG